MDKQPDRWQGGKMYRCGRTSDNAAVTAGKQANRHCHLRQLDPAIRGRVMVRIISLVLGRANMQSEASESRSEGKRRARRSSPCRPPSNPRFELTSG